MKSYDQLTLDLSAGLKLLVANLCLFGKLELGIWSLEFPPKSGHKVNQNYLCVRSRLGKDLQELNEYGYDCKSFQCI